MGNTCKIDRRNYENTYKIIKVIGTTIKEIPQKQQQLHQIPLEIMSSLDRFDDDFFQKEYCIDDSLKNLEQQINLRDNQKTLDKLNIQDLQNISNNFNPQQQTKQELNYNQSITLLINKNNKKSSQDISQNSSSTIKKKYKINQQIQGILKHNSNSPKISQRIRNISILSVDSNKSRKSVKFSLPKNGSRDSSSQHYNKQNKKQQLRKRTQSIQILLNNQY